MVEGGQLAEAELLKQEISEALPGAELSWEDLEFAAKNFWPVILKRFPYLN